MNTTSDISVMGYLKQEKVVTLANGKVLDNNVYPDPYNHMTAKSYMIDHLCPTLNIVLNDLVNTIEKNGEFERYVDMLEERQEKAQKELRKREKERRRLEMGDDYDSAEEERKFGPNEHSSEESSSSSSSSSESEHENKGKKETLRTKQSAKKSAVKNMTPD